MDGEKCAILLSILKNGSLSGAAEELSYTQSGISRAVEAIEKEAGFPILRRGRGGASLTREGEQLLPAVREIAHWTQCYGQLVRKLRGAQTGRLCVGSAYAKYFPWLTRAVLDFHEKYPGVTVEMCSGTSSELASRMNERTLDFGIISRRGGDFRSIPFRRDELVAMLPPEHPMARSRSVPAGIFEREPYIDIHGGQQTDNSLCFQARGITPKTAFSTHDSYVACGMVRAGLGAALVNRVIAEELRGGVVYVPLEPPEFVDICAVSPSDEVISPAARLFCGYIMPRLIELRSY